MGQRGGTLYFKIEPSILGSLHNFFLGSNGPIKIGSLQKKKKKKKKEELNLVGTSSNE
jgi:hypothetical protein